MAANKYLSQAANTAPAMRVTGETNSRVVLYTTGTTSSTGTIPSGWRGRWVRALAATADCKILFGDVSTVDVDRTISSDTPANGGGLDPTLGMTLVTGVPEQFRIPDTATHIALEAGAAGTLELTLAEGWETRDQVD